MTLRAAAATWILALTPAAGHAAPAVGDEGPPPSAVIPAPGRSQGGTGTPLTVLEGTLRTLDLPGHAVVVEVAGAPVRLGIDRNTLVYAPAGLSTAAALRPGDQVRLARNGRDVAYWIEVRRTSTTTTAPSPTRGQGTGPGGGTAAPPEGRSPATPPGSGSGAPPR